jgi:hypothetical protein
MGSFSGDEPAKDHAARVASLADSDRALLLAATAWGEPRERPETGESRADLLTGFHDRLAPAWLQRLRGGLDQEKSLTEWSDRASALEHLRKMHQAMARVDLARVHPSWLVRALQEESPAVQRLVAASLPDSLRHHVQAGLLLDSQDLRSERAAAPDVASWVMALWTERLVGCEAERANDSPGLVVLVRLTPRAGYRICRMAGICKLILAGQPPDRDGAASHQARHDWLAGRLADANADLRAASKRDVEVSRSSKLPLRHQPARIGLTTIARLLADTEPFRLRWALQHWPYPIAKMIRSLLPRAANRPASLVESESLILKTAWDRLNLEGSLAPAWPETYCAKFRGTGTDRVALQTRPESSLFNSELEEG